MKENYKEKYVKLTYLNILSIAILTIIIIISYAHFYEQQDLYLSQISNLKFDIFKKEIQIKRLKYSDSVHTVELMKYKRVK